MKKPIVLFGASGKSGQAIVGRARQLGLSVREADRRVLAHPKALDRIIKGVFAVVIVFGPRPPYTDIFCTSATGKIIQSMKRSGVKRLLCQTGAMIGRYPQNRSFLFEKMSNIYRKQNPSGYMDRVKQEDIIKHTPLDWTIIKPPRLVDSDKEKVVYADEHTCVGIFSSITRTSLSGFILKELSHPKRIRKVVFVTN